MQTRPLLLHEAAHYWQGGTMKEPAWLEAARADLGIEEIAGPQANPRIMQYYKAAGADWAKDDAVPWCGAAMAAWVSAAGHPVPPEAARARAWLDWGERLDAPRKGCVTILKRGVDPTAGHVTLWLEDKGDRFLALGGNQGDAVSITSYPKSSVIGYRWPAGAPMAKTDLPEGPVLIDVAGNDKPMLQSKTVGWTMAGLGAAIVQFFNDVASAVVEWAAAVVSFGPIKAALTEIGANAKAVALAVGVGAGVGVLGERAKKKLSSQAARDGKLG